MRLHHNKSNGIFSVRRPDRSTLVASQKHPKLPLIGNIVALSKNVFLLITKGEYIEATTGSRPFLTAVVTSWPRVRLVIKRIMEIIK
ncbi:hypothetical protein [Pectobacterium phage Jarilo]|uniref:Uncharacterized protein n=1 Tax=Pectobacterium phage Jarilo TaxID=2163634 RepID=A0A2S1GT09_9CAUD|nr:hypothetical protein HOT17_gp11 [Pectobacterium phage Jarilo]AWD92492.1 hypothetical protein [Pectobacterium phage Jarilo]